MTVNNIIKNKPYLAWYVKDPEKLSEESILEHVLNNGNWEDVQLFIKVKGINETAKLFNKSFFHYPFHIERDLNFEEIIKLPDILTLGAMKAFVLGRRAKWKDYVDLYFIFQKHSLQELI